MRLRYCIGTLDLSRNGIHDAGGAFIAGSLKDVPQLETLHHQQPPIDCLTHFLSLTRTSETLVEEIPVAALLSIGAAERELWPHTHIPS